MSICSKAERRIVDRAGMNEHGFQLNENPIASNARGEEQITQIDPPRPAIRGPADLGCRRSLVRRRLADEAG